jgi:hypothetical protein
MRGRHSFVGTGSARVGAARDDFRRFSKGAAAQAEVLGLQVAALV